MSTGSSLHASAPVDLDSRPAEACNPDIGGAIRPAAARNGKLSVF